MKWFYNKEKDGVVADVQPEGYHYNFRGEDLLTPTREPTAEELEKALELEELKTRYMEKFGKKPNGRSRADTLKKALGDDS